MKAWIIRCTIRLVRLQDQWLSTSWRLLQLGQAKENHHSSLKVLIPQSNMGRTKMATERSLRQRRPATRSSSSKRKRSPRDSLWKKRRRTCYLSIRWIRTMRRDREHNTTSKLMTRKLIWWQSQPSPKTSKKLSFIFKKNKRLKKSGKRKNSQHSNNTWQPKKREEITCDH